MATRVVAPLTGTVTAGTWVLNQKLVFAGGPSSFGGMQYNYLLPAQYDTTGNTLYPIVMWGHPLDGGMNGSVYPRAGSAVVTGNTYGGATAISLDTAFNTVAFRRGYPCIFIAPECDQTLDLGGANGNANFGGYADSQNSGWNERAVNALLTWALANIAGADSGRAYAVGTSLGAIGALAWLVDNNQINGPSGLSLWTAAVGMSEQLQRPATANSTVFTRMRNVPYLAISWESDNAPASYDKPFWQSITGNTSYPVKSTYDSGGMAAIRAGTTQYYYISTPLGGSSPWFTFMKLNADGGDGTTWWTWLFSQTASGPITPPPPPDGTVILTPGSGGSFTDSAGHVYTLPASGVATEDGAAMKDGGNTSAMELYQGVVYAQDATSHDWFTWNGSSFNGPVAAPPSAPTTPPAPAGTTNWYDNPGQDRSFWKLPFQTTAQWITSGSVLTQLRNGGFSAPRGFVKQQANFCVGWFRGVATDPLVTVTQGTKSIQVRVPVGSSIELPLNSTTDSSIGGCDTTKPYLVWNASGATINNSAGTVAASGSVITAGYGLHVDDGSGTVMMDVITGSDGTNNSFGASVLDHELTKARLDASYVIPHMLTYELDPTQVSRDPAIWPLKNIDQSFPNPGTVPQGYTIGIPRTTVRPTGKSRGFYTWFDNAQQFGWFFYNVSGNNCLTMAVYSTDSANAALVSDMANTLTDVVQYLCILSNQTGLSSMKGWATGGVDAYPAPPLLDYSPTGGVPVAPSTFGAWYPSGYNVMSVPAAVTPALTIVTPSQQNAGASFAVNGGIAGYSTAPTLNFSINGGTFAALPTGNSVTATAFTFTCPGLAIGTNQTITVRDANSTSVSVSTGPFNVVAVAAPVITPTAPSFPVTNLPFTLSGTLANYASAPALTFSDNSSAPASLPGGSSTFVTTTSFTFLHAAIAAGSYTTVIADSGSTQGSVNYSVTTIAGGASQNLTTVTSTTTFFIDSASNRWSISSGGRVVLNGVDDTATSSVVELAWVNGVIWHKNASGSWYSKTSATAATWTPGTDPLANLPAIAINAITGVAPNTAFDATGSLTNYGTFTPTLTYKDGTGPATAFPSGSTISSTSFRFTHPGLAAGSYLLTVSDGGTSGTANYTIATPGWTSLPSTTNLTDTISNSSSTPLLASTAYDVEVYATNSVGQSQPSEIITVTTAASPVIAPGVPTGLTSTIVADVSVTLTWVAPTTGTAPFTYITRSSPAGQNSWTAGPSVATTSAQIVGLTQSTSYDFEVAAVNAAGNGLYSAPYTVSTVATPAAAVAWDPASIVGPITLSNSNFTATTGGSATVYGQSQAVLSTTSLASGNASFEITLPTITQNCALGLVLATHASTADFGADTASFGYYPSTGTGSQAAQTMFYNGLLALTPPGSAPAADVAGAVFTFCVNRTGGLWWVTGPAMQARYGASAWNNSATANPSTGAGGVSFAAMTGAVFIGFHSSESGGSAILNAGSSAFTRASSIPSTFPPWGGSVITVVVPGAVTSLALAGSATDVSAPLSWSAPTTGTLPITYLIMRSPHNTVAFAQVASTANLTITATGLSASTSYDFKVIASNSAGSGPASNVLTVTTAATVTIPGAPLGLSAGAPTSSTVVLTWQAPSSGSPPTDYQVQYKKSTDSSYSNFSPTAKDVTQTITGLLAGLTYNFQVYAINSAGSGVVSSPVLSVTMAPASAIAPLFADEFSTLAITDTGSAAAAQAGTRKWYQVIGGDRTLLTTPFQTTAKWITSGTQVTALRAMSFASVRSEQTTGFVTPLWISLSTSDPLCTFHDSTGTIADFQMRVPIGAHSENGSTGSGDNSACFIDSSLPYKYVNVNDCRIGTSASDATAAKSVSTTNKFITCGPGAGSPGGMAAQDATGPVLMDAVTNIMKADGSAWENSDNGAGCVTYYDLQQCIADSSYVIQHMTALNFGLNFFNNTFVWPLTARDNGGTGPTTEGVIIGIPASTTRPTGKTRAFYAIFDMLQHFGGIFNNVTTNNQIAFKTMPRDTATAAFVASMNTEFINVVPYLCILDWTNGVAGAQYSLATLKGRLATATSWSDAFPAPPLLDFSQTGGVSVAPSTFGAWQGSNGVGQSYNVNWESTLNLPSTVGAWMNHYPFGGAEFTLSANNEAEYYTSTSRGGFNPFSLGGGVLTIKADKAIASAPGTTTTSPLITNPGGLQYDSGAMTSATETNSLPTRGLYDYTYGYAVARILNPDGRGLWPAFWRMPLADGNGEVDFMEALGHDKLNVYQTIHYSTSDTNQIVALTSDTTAVSTRQVKIAVTDYTTNWHTYGADVQSDFVTFYVDEVAKARIPTPAEVKRSSYLLANLAVGGVNSWPGPADSSTSFPARMQIDYIRVWTNFAASTGVTTPTPPPTSITFQDTFGSLSIHRTWQTGDKWQLIAPDTPDGRGGKPKFGEDGTMWWTNPFNPNTQISGLYNIVSGGLQLAVMGTPSANASYINTTATVTLPYVACLLNTSQTNYQKYGYWETTVAVPRIPGLTFQASLENVQVTNQWPPEIDIRISTNGSSVQTVLLQFALSAANGGTWSQFTVSSASGFDARLAHVYGISWQSDFIEFYIDNALAYQQPTPTTGAYTTNPMFLFLLSATNYDPPGTTVNPSLASLPAGPLISALTVYLVRPTPTTNVHIFPGIGSFSDSSGAIWSIDASGNVLRKVGTGSATPVAGGSGTAEMTYYNNTVYAREAAAPQRWFTYNGTGWVVAATAPP